MLFNSYVFIFAFLPLTLTGFYLLAAVFRGKGKRRASIAFLVFASLVYYGWWNPVYLSLIGVSIVVNFYLGTLLSRESINPRRTRNVLILGVVFNLSLLFYFKYAGFFVHTLDIVFSQDFGFHDVVLPLAISFFTFQQIAYLVDAKRRTTSEHSFLDYCLFVTFFPQLIAGPIVHHKEMLPQFSLESSYSLSVKNLSCGAAFFTIGLFKKVVIADTLSMYANPVFDGVLQGIAPSFFDGWAGALAFTFQLYFDFSGYSDMAIGLGLLFGIRLPVNFNSPYKAKNIVEFWRRWHMTLSRFLRDYLYIPLGGSRRGMPRRYVNLMLTMLLGGLWHGAGWTFVIWGGLHGLYLCLNHGFGFVMSHLGFQPGFGGIAGRIVAQTTTFLAVIIGWVFFRAENLSSCTVILQSMTGLDGFSLYSSIGLARKEVLVFTVLAMIIALFMPNSSEIMADYARPLGWSPEENDRGVERFVPAILKWRPTVSYGVLIGMAAVLAILFISRANEFLYFQF